MHIDPLNMDNAEIDDYVGIILLGLSEFEISEVDGGVATWKKVVYITGGTVLLANSIAIGVVATPATGVVAAGTGVYLIGCAF